MNVVMDKQLDIIKIQEKEMSRVRFNPALFSVTIPSPSC